jgi:hypothetical protein
MPGPSGGASPRGAHENQQVDKGSRVPADTSVVGSDEADRIEHRSVWPDDAPLPSVEPGDDDGLEALLVDARAAAKIGAEWFANEFRRREAEEVRHPTFPPRQEPTPVDAEVEASAIDEDD